MVALGENAEFSEYLAKFIAPLIATRVDDGVLAVILNHELDEWESEAERPDGVSFAHLAVNCINEILADLRTRIKAKIAAAEAVLNGLPA